MEMFQPMLSLDLERDGEYTLDALTITPNRCYSAGCARPGVPANVRITGETFAVLLPLHVRRGPCAMVVTPVRHRLRNLRLGPAVGKTQVLAFAMVDDRVVGSASIPVAARGPCPKDPSIVDTSDWYAWKNLMPPGPPSLHVTGVVHLPSPGYRADLEVAAPQGINPRDLILDLRVQKLPGIWPQVITPMSVRYDQHPLVGDYDTMLIREPDGDAVQLDIDSVH